MRHRFLEVSYRRLEWQNEGQEMGVCYRALNSVSNTVQNALCYMFNSVVIAVFCLKKPRLRELK